MGTTSARRRRNADPFDVSHLVAEAAERQVLAGVLDLIDRDPASAREIIGLVTAEKFHADHTAYVFSVLCDVLAAIAEPTHADVYRSLRKQGFDDGTDQHALFADLASDRTATGKQAARLAREAAVEVRENHQRRQAIESVKQFVCGGGSPSDLPRLVEELQHVHADAAGISDVSKPSGKLVLIQASQIECGEINWLWPQRIVGDGLTIITGPVGISKSLISVDAAARVSTGGKWPDSTGHAPQGSVILFGAEDDAGKVVVPRLIAAGADLSRVHVCQGTASGDSGDESPEVAAMILERHIGQLRAALDDVADCRLIVFDPLPDYIAADENKSAEVRAALVPLARLAQERNVAVVAVAHQNKKNDLTTVQRIAGSSAFAQLARVVLSIGTHPEDADKQSGKRRVMLVSKNNYGERDVGQAYAIETRASGQPGLVWEPGIITMDADEIARRPTGGREHEDRRGAAVDALRDLLAVGEQSVVSVTAALQDAGLGRRQINHAADVLNVIKTKRRDGWYWRLPARLPDDETPMPDPAFAAWGPDQIEPFNRT